MFRKKVIIDINSFPSCFKNEKGEVGVAEIKKYENAFNVKVVPYDCSVSNVKGQTSSPSFL